MFICLYNPFMMLIPRPTSLLGASNRKCRHLRGPQCAGRWFLHANSGAASPYRPVAQAGHARRLSATGSSRFRGPTGRKPPEKTLVVRNTSQEAIRIWLPQNRKERILTNASERDLRRRMCQHQRVRMVEVPSVREGLDVGQEFADILQQDLDRKEEQAKHAAPWLQRP